MGRHRQVRKEQFMRKIIAIILTVMLIMSVAITTYAAENSATLYEDYPFYGRLYVPDVGIDVALYSSIQQEVSDREDSANIYSWQGYRGRIIADHASQEFSKLFDVQVGTKGYINTETGETIRFKCVDMFDGYRNKGIRDESGNLVYDMADYVMYTCRDSKGEEVRVFLWDKYEEEVTVPEYTANIVPIDKIGITFKMPKIVVSDIPKGTHEKIKTTLPSNFFNNWLKANPLNIKVG
jgi:hypothetical protein